MLQHNVSNYSFVDSVDGLYLIQPQKQSCFNMRPHLTPFDNKDEDVIVLYRNIPTATVRNSLLAVKVVVDASCKTTGT